MSKKISLIITMLLLATNTYNVYGATNNQIVQAKPTFCASDVTLSDNVTSEQLRQVVPDTMKELVNDIIQIYME